jgi:hypothetical protein
MNTGRVGRKQSSFNAYGTASMKVRCGAARPQFQSEAQNLNVPFGTVSDYDARPPAAGSDFFVNAQPRTVRMPSLSRYAPNIIWFGRLRAYRLSLGKQEPAGELILSRPGSTAHSGTARTSHPSGELQLQSVKAPRCPPSSAAYPRLDLTPAATIELRFCERLAEGSYRIRSLEPRHKSRPR